MPQVALPKPSQARNINFPGVIFAFSSRQDGNMSLRYGRTQDALTNRKNFLGGLGIDYRSLVCAKQIHGSNIEYASTQYIGKGALAYEAAIDNTDALITDEKNIPLAVFTADCLSVFLYDSQTPSIGLVHAGWRSAKEDILTKAVKLMQERFNTEVKNLSAVFGPAIKECCYEAKEDFLDFFPRGVTKRNNRLYLDLAALNKKQLLEAGAKEGNIFDPGICTSCRKEDFFSYRREGVSCGRMMSVVMLK